MKFNVFKSKAKRIHLDYASTTPVAPEVLSAMLPYFNTEWANPNAVYREGVRVRKVVEDAREELARVLRVRPQDVTFTSGGTESNNLALIGIVEALHEEGCVYENMEIISTKIEHPSILETLTYLEKRGVQVMYAPVTEEGTIDSGALGKLFSEKTILVTFAYSNSEVGVIQNVKKISRLVRAWNGNHERKIVTHIDASQTPLWVSCELDMLGVDLMTLDAGKCYGPKGAGVLVHRHWVKLSPLIHGGKQEYGLRAGTENTALIVGCARAIVRAQGGYEARSLAVAKLRDSFIEHLVKEIPGVHVNGSRESRIANNVNISILGLDTEYATIWLDAQGIAVSTRSACGSGEGTGSSVVREMLHDESRAQATLRFTFGEETTKQDLIYTVEMIKKHLALMHPYTAEKRKV